MINGVNTPDLCLKLGVARALVYGKRTDLNTAPMLEDGKVLIPNEALALIGIGTDGQYTSLDTLSCEHICSMGMILINKTEGLDGSIKDDKRYMVSLARRFVFEIPHIEMRAGFDPATEDERASFSALGEQIYSMLCAHGTAHPYIMTSRDGLKGVRTAYASDKDTYLKHCIQKFLDRLPGILEELPEFDEQIGEFLSALPSSGYGEDEYDEGGRHITSESHMDRAQTLAMAYHATGEKKYAVMAYRIVMSVIGRKHWGPGHFLNCAGAAGYLSIVYDWLYDIWSDLGLDTSAVRRGIYDQGIHHAYNSAILDCCDFPSPKQGSGWRFKGKRDNWSSVNNGLMTVACLTVLGDGTDGYIDEEKLAKTKELLGCCICSMLHEELMLNQYAPDGSYIESNTYWSYGTTNLARAMGALYTAIGTDLGIHNAIGLDRTCYYAMNVESPDRLGWNYHDGYLVPQDTVCFNIFATVSGDEALYTARKNDIMDGKSVQTIDIVFHPELIGRSIPDSLPLPLSYYMEGIDALVVRSGWEHGSLYAGMIGGVNPTGGSHNQLDSGTFVYHNLGVMWFTELGFDNYNVEAVDGKGYFSNYGLYKRNAEGNNDLCVKSCPYGQTLGGRGWIEQVKESDDLSYFIINNDSVYGDNVISAKRGMMLKDRRSLVIADRVIFKTPDTACWVAHYESDNITAIVHEDGKTCTMEHKDGKRIYLTLIGDGAKFEIRSTYDYLLDGTAPAGREHDRSGYMRLCVICEDITSLDMAVVIDTEPGTYGEHIPMDRWDTV